MIYDTASDINPFIPEYFTIIETLNLNYFIYFPFTISYSPFPHLNILLLPPNLNITVITTH